MFKMFAILCVLSSADCRVMHEEPPRLFETWADCEAASVIKFRDTLLIMEGTQYHSLDVDSYVNVATFACGNTLTSAAIRTILEKYNYAPTDTLVMFNVTSMSRLDFKVKYNNSNDFIPWKEDLLDFTFLKPHSSAWLGALKEADISVEEIVKRNTHEMHLLFEYLTENAYPFVFTTMEDYSHLPLIQKYKDNLVPLPGNGMFEYARSVDMLIEHDYFHPSGEGQVQMAKLTHDFIKKKYNIDG